MKILPAIIALSLYTPSVYSQEIAITTQPPSDETGVDSIVVGRTSDAIVFEEPINLPSLTELGTMPEYTYPMFWHGGFNSWTLHQGMNVSLGASVFSTFGSGNTWKGAGFSQNVSLMYAIPLKHRLTLAIGGYFTNTLWAHDTYREVGLSGILNYQINERWDAFLYGQKTIMQTANIPQSLYDMGDMGDRIGLGVKYKINPSITVELRMEERISNRNLHIIPKATQTNAGISNASPWP